MTNSTSFASPRILISRLSAVGDCILTIPLLCALRDTFPHAFIAWVVEPGAAPLLQAHAALDRLIVVPKGWLKSPREVLKLRRELRALRFEIALDPQSLTKSSLVARLSGAKCRIGFAKPHGRELAPWLNNVRVTKTAEHVVDHQMELLRPLGVAITPARFDLPCDAAADAKIAQFIREAKLESNYIVINPGAGWDSRLWPVERYAAVARTLGEKFGTQSVVAWAGEREQNWAQQIANGAGGHARLAPPTNLPELATLLRGARFYLGSDTGPMHLAVAVGTRCVALFGTTRYQQSGPYGTGHHCLQEYFQAGTSRERRAADNEAMRAITVEKVHAASVSLWNATHNKTSTRVSDAA